VPIVLKSGSLNLLEPPGPVQGCNGIALPLPLLRREWHPWTRNLILFTPGSKVILFAKEMVLLEVKIVFVNNTIILLCGKKKTGGFFNFEGRIYSALKLLCNNNEDFEASEITDMYDRMQGNVASL